MNLYGLIYHDYDTEQEEYYYEVEEVPATNAPIFKRSRIVSTEKRLKKIGNVYTIDGKDCELVDIGKIDSLSEVENNRGFLVKKRETKNIYYVTPVMAGGKRSVKETRKAKKKSKSKKTRRV